jgi:hypothetical protein
MALCPSSFDRRRRLLVSSVLVALVLWRRLTPVIRIGLIRCRSSGTPVLSRGSSTLLVCVAGSTGLSVLLFISESRGLPRSSFNSLLHFAAGLLSLLRTFRRSRSKFVSSPVTTGSCINRSMNHTDVFKSTVGPSSSSLLLFNLMLRPSAVDCIAGLFFQSRSSVRLFPYLSIVVCSGLNRYCCQAYWLYLLLKLCYGA